MVAVILITPQEMQQKIAEKARAKRLMLNLSQQTLSDRSGVSYGALKKFERTGQISLHSLLKIALVLGSLSEFHELFTVDPLAALHSLDQLMAQEEPRKRGRR